MVTKNINRVLTVIIPVFNEENTILHLVSEVCKQNLVNQIIIVDDGSTDKTSEFLKSFYGKRKIFILTHDKNYGKGAAIRTALPFINSPFVIIQDADLEYSPLEYRKLVNPLLNNKADIVLGSRFQSGEQRRILYFWHYIGNRFLTTISNIFTNLNLSDMETCFKVMRSEIFKSLNLNENGFGIEPEIIAKISRHDWRIYEVGISYFGRTYAEGKKITWKDGLRAIYCIVKYNIFR